MPAPEDLVAFGPGKVILLGEHGVVYGQPALAGPLSWGVTARGWPAKKPTLQIPDSLSRPARRLLQSAFQAAATASGSPRIRVSLESELPPSMGLGSSAAVSVACARLLLMARNEVQVRPAEVARVAWEMEKIFHGTPSGVDHTCSAEDALIHFRRRPGSDPPAVRRVECPRPLKVLVALVGERRSTKETVAALGRRQERWPERYGRLFQEIGRAVDEGRRAVEKGDLEVLGDLMNINQGLLGALGLSSSGIESMVYRLRSLGALGAKLTGAGGDGGAVIGLFLEPEPAVARLTREGVRCFSSQVAGPRVL
jgi:mevalonate kinase